MSDTKSTTNLYPSLEEFQIDQGLLSEVTNLYPQLTMSETEHDQEGGEIIPYDPIVQYITQFKEKAVVNYKKAEVKQGLREVILFKNQQGKIGIAFTLVDMGLFISLVEKESAASLAGIRFGEQLIALNGEPVCGIKKQKLYRQIHNLSLNQEIRLVVRDRPYAKIFNLAKDKTGQLGFTFHNGMIKDLIKDSSATKNGLQINHQIIEVNGQNVIGFSDSELNNLLKQVDTVVTLTVMEKDFFKKMGSESKKRFNNMSHCDPIF